MRTAKAASPLEYIHKAAQAKCVIGSLTGWWLSETLHDQECNLRWVEKAVSTE